MKLEYKFKIKKCVRNSDWMILYRPTKGLLAYIPFFWRAVRKFIVGKTWIGHISREEGNMQIVYYDNRESALAKVTSWVVNDFTFADYLNIQKQKELNYLHKQKEDNRSIIINKISDLK